MKMVNLIASFLVLLISGYFYYLTTSFPSINAQVTGPAFIPRFYIYGLICLSIILILQSLKIKNEKVSGNTKMVLLSMILIVVYVFIIAKLGFYVSTLLFLTLILWITKVRRLLTLVTVPIGTLLFLFLFFQKLLKVSLPTGIFF